MANSPSRRDRLRPFRPVSHLHCQATAAVIAIGSPPPPSAAAALDGQDVVGTAAAAWPWCPAGVVILAGLLVVCLWRKRAARIRNSRRLTIDRVRSLCDRRPEETLHQAFLAVAAAEECMRRSGVPHASVWVHAANDAERLLVAEFGQSRTDAVRRTQNCCAEGVMVRDSFRLLDQDGTKDLVLCLREAGPIEFEILLHKLAKVDSRMLDDLEAATLPVRAGLRKQAWLDRLEADFVQKSASIEVEVHDLRSPLTTLRLSAQELAESAAGHADEQVRSAAGNVTEAAESVIASIEGMVRHLDRASRLQLVAGDPAAIALARARALAPTAAAKNITLELFAPRAVTGAMIDPVWFGRVVENVVGNAVKYSPRGTTVRVTCEVEPRQFVLRVHDEGPGFSDTERETVCLPGATGSAQPTGGEPQTGMGLWIARQAMRAMGGRLWIEPKAGRGACVSLSIPTRGPAAEATPGPS